MAKRNYAALPHEYLEEMAELSDAEFGRLCRALIQYSVSGIKPELAGPERYCANRAYMQEDRFQASRNGPVYITDGKPYIKDNGRHTPEYRAWRKAVFERDNYTCQLCGSKGGTLNAHHIERYRNCIQRRTDVSNGITLCYACHKKIHHLEGK